MSHLCTVLPDLSSINIHETIDCQDYFSTIYKRKLVTEAKANDEIKILELSKTPPYERIRIKFPRILNDGILFFKNDIHSKCKKPVYKWDNIVNPWNDHIFLLIRRTFTLRLKNPDIVVVISKKLLDEIEKRRWKKFFPYPKFISFLGGNMSQLIELKREIFSYIDEFIKAPNEALLEENGIFEKPIKVFYCADTKKYGDIYHSFV